MTDYIILGFLMDRDMTGYSIKQWMSRSTSYFADASFGSIYPSLKRLEQKGLIRSKETIEKGKLKKVYSILDKGRETFLQWLQAPVEASRSSIAGALSKIFFYGRLPVEQAVALLAAYVADLNQYKADLLNLKKEIMPHAGGFELCTLDFGLDYYDFVMHWYESYMKKLKEKIKE